MVECLAVLRLTVAHGRLCLLERPQRALSTHFTFRPSSRGSIPLLRINESVKRSLAGRPAEHPLSALLMVEQPLRLRVVRVTVQAVWLCVWLCVYVCGCVAMWLCGCVVVWLCGCVAVWVGYRD